MTWRSAESFEPKSESPDSDPQRGAETADEKRMVMDCLDRTKNGHLLVLQSEACRCENLRNNLACPNSTLGVLLHRARLEVRECLRKKRH